MTHKQHPIRKKAEALYDFQNHNAAWCAKKHRTTTNNIYRWQKELDTDPRLQAELDKVTARYEQFWADELGATINEAQTTIRECLKQLPRDSPASLNAAIKAIEALAPIQTAHAIRMEQREEEKAAQAQELRIGTEEEVSAELEEELELLAEQDSAEAAR